MPRHRKPTPARGRRAVPGETAGRKRKPTSAPELPVVAEDASVGGSAFAPPAVAAAPSVLPRTTRPAPPPTPQADYDPLRETRDTRPFRERVLSRRGTVGLLLFRIGPETFAAELGAVEEAVEVPELHGLPEMRNGMLGMFDLRGKLLPVFSAAAVLGVSLAPGSVATLVVRAGDRRVGIAVDDVDDVIEVECASLRYAPGSADADGVLLAILQRGTALASVIDAAALVAACVASSPESA